MTDNILDRDRRSAYGELEGKIDGFKYRADYPDLTNGRITYYFWEGGWSSEERTVAIRFREWWNRPHGNAPSGTPIGSFRVTLPNHRRRTVTLV